MIFHFNKKRNRKIYVPLEKKKKKQQKAINVDKTKELE